MPRRPIPESCRVGYSPTRGGRHRQRAALRELAPTDVPRRPAVAVRQFVPGAPDGDRIADQGLVEQPAGVLGRHVDAAVRDVARALGTGRPGRGVDVLATPGEALRELDVGDVALIAVRVGGVE